MGPKADNVMATSSGGAAAIAPQSYGPATASAGLSALRASPYSDYAGLGDIAATELYKLDPMSQSGAILLGTISTANEKFAFIKQDNGEADMFVIPPACEAFGRELPPVGARVQYRVVVDSKTGRPRADRVQPAMC